MCSPSLSFQVHSSIFLFTNIHNLSISLRHSLVLSPIYLSPSLSATFTVTLQTCKPSPSLSLAYSLVFTSHPHPLYSLRFWTQPVFLSPSPSPSLSFFSHVNHHFSNMYTIALSFSRSRFSLHAAMLTSFILFCCGPHLSLSLSFFLNLSLQPHSPTLLSSVGYTASLCLSSATLTLTLQALPPSLSSLSLSLQPHSPILLSSVVDATSIPFSFTLAFSLQPHSPTLLSSVGDTASLCLSSATLTLTLQTRTLPPSLSLFHFFTLSLSLSISLSLYLSISLLFYAHTTNHNMMDQSLHFPIATV